jgi:putative peptidoglycan lipid II flippase
MRDARTPVTISIVSVLVNAALNIALVRAMGYVGLGLGTAVASLINAGLLLFLLRRRLGGIDGRRIAWAVLRMSLASSVMAACVWAVHLWLESLVPGSLLPVQMLRVGLAIVTGLVVLVAVSRVLRIDEFDEAIGKLVRRLRPVKTGGTHG